MTPAQAKAFTLSKPAFLLERLYATDAVTNAIRYGWVVHDYRWYEDGWFRLMLRTEQSGYTEIMVVSVKI